jgi:phosphatidate cytidylyltransferase
MRSRVSTALLLLLFGFPAVAFGGVFYFFVIAFFLVTAAWEYAVLFEHVKTRPSRLMVAGGVLFILAVRAFQVELFAPVFAAFILLAMAHHVIQYEKGNETVAVDFAITAAGLAYFGWVGSYLIDIRSLEHGGWWVMIILPSVWFADTGAYLIGVPYGKHKMVPRLSPKKSWEGFFGGVFTSVIGTAFLAYAYSTWGPLEITPWQGALLGLLTSSLSLFGDLGESMVKRQVGMKDSGALLPGHGGAWDRVDSWLWGGVIGYYFVLWMFPG